MHETTFSSNIKYQRGRKNSYFVNNCKQRTISFPSKNSRWEKRRLSSTEKKKKKSPKRLFMKDRINKGFKTRWSSPAYSMIRSGLKEEKTGNHWFRLVIDLSIHPQRFQYQIYDYSRIPISRTLDSSSLPLSRRKTRFLWTVASLQFYSRFLEPT